MAIKIDYNGKMMAHVNMKGVIVFEDGPDLNPIIDRNIGAIKEEEDDFGNVIFESVEASLEQKLIYLQGIGFTIRRGDKE